MIGVNKRILHLTHTDIRSDSRILKAMQVGVSLGCKVIGVGLDLDESVAPTAASGLLDIRTLRLRSRTLNFFPRGVRHVLSLLESIVRMFPFAVKCRPNVVHCHDVVMLPLAALVSLSTNSRLVYDAHELESNRNGLSSRLGALTLWVERRLWSFVDLLIVVSPSIEKWYTDNVGPKNTIVILNTPEVCAVQPRSASYLRDRFNIPVDTVIFIYVGLLTQGRGIELVIEAFKRNHDNAALVFLGYGDYERQISKISGQFNSKVYLHPPVPHAEVVSVVQSADVGICLIENVSLSDYFSLPNKLFEYAFSGVQVLASKFPDIEQVVSRYRLGVCADLEIESVVEAMARLKDQAGVDVKVDLTDISWAAQSMRLSERYRRLLSLE